MNFVVTFSATVCNNTLQYYVSSVKFDDGYWNNYGNARMKFNNISLTKCNGFSSHNKCFSNISSHGNAFFLYPRKHQKTNGFLIFSRGIEREPEIG